LLLPIGAWPMAHQAWHAIPAQAWIGLGLVIVGPTVAAYLLNAWALRHTDSSLVAAYTYLQPVLTAILAAIFLRETIRPVVVAEEIADQAPEVLVTRVGRKTARIGDHTDEAGEEAHVRQRADLRRHAVDLVQEPPRRAVLHLAGHRAVLEIADHRGEQLVVARIDVVEDGFGELAAVVES